MAKMVQERALQSQFGVTVTDATAYGKGGGDAAFAVGQNIYVRFNTRIPKGSVINSATVRFQLAVKTQTTAQFSTHEVRADARGDSPVLRPGVLEATRLLTSTVVSWTPQWPASPPDPAAVFGVINVKPLLDELMARSDYVPGGYVTFVVRCVNENGSDMSVRLNNIFAPSPRLEVDFTPPVSDLFIDFNRCENSEFSSILDGLGDDDPATTGNIPGWGQNAFFGGWVDPASASRCTMAVDTSFTRLPGIPTLRITAGTPPATPAFTGPMAGFLQQPGEGFIFAGWVYLPAATSGMDVYAGDAYDSFYNISGLPRGVWRPFCSAPLSNTTPDQIIRWPAIGIRNFVAGTQFWISEPMFLASPIRQMPFNGLTPDRSQGYVDHLSTISSMASRREWVPRRTMLIGGVPKRTPSWTRRSDVATAIVELSEPVKGGPQIGALPAGVTIGGLPAGQTVTEL